MAKKTTVARKSVDMKLCRLEKKLEGALERVKDKAVEKYGWRVTCFACDHINRALLGSNSLPVVLRRLKQTSKASRSQNIAYEIFSTLSKTIRKETKRSRLTGLKGIRIEGVGYKLR